MPLLPHQLDRGALARFQRNVLGYGGDGCWLWIGPTMPNGYGKHRAYPGQRERAAHVISWEHENGPVPDSLQLDHLCRNRPCVRPDHLEAVTQSVNIQRQDHANRRKDTCPQGHPYDERNTRYTRDMKRACRACDAARKRARATSVTRAASAE